MNWKFATHRLFHNGTGGSSGTCDPAVPPPTGDHTIFTLGTSIAAVAEAAVGRTGPTQLGRYTSDLARVQLNGVETRYRTVVTARGTQIVADLPGGTKTAKLQVSISP